MNLPVKRPNRYLFNAISLICFIIIFLNCITRAATLPTKQNYTDKECSSNECQKEASFFRNIIDPEIDPCDDFYQFACGNFIKNATIPENENHISIVGTVQKNLRNQIIDDVKEIKEDDIEAFKKVKQFYDNCLKHPGEETTETLLDIINNSGGMPVLSSNDDNWTETNFDWIRAVSKARNYGFPLRFPVRLYTTIELQNPKYNIPVISNPTTKVNDKFFSNETHAKEAYLQFMVDVTVMLGANKNVATEELQKCIDFEMKLFKIESPWEDIGPIPKPLRIKELSQKNPSIPWLDFLRTIYEPSGITVDENQRVIISDPPAIDKLEQLIATTPKKVIANYIFWRIIYDAVDYLSDKFVDRQSQYHEIGNEVDRVKKCGKETVESFPVAISALYVRKHQTKDNRNNSMELAHNIKKEFQKVIQQAQWLDNPTRNAALEKLQAMDVSVGIYDEYFDDKELNKFYHDVEINDGTYLRAAFNLSKFYIKDSDNLLGKPDNTKKWFSHFDAATINAYYLRAVNYFELAASLLQRPFFNAKRPQYLNYGNLGTTIGHEITHGFDSEGRFMDKDGNDINWWNNVTEKNYLEKAKCFLDQYNNYTVEEIGLNLNGERTQAENIADNGGTKVAYNAYIEWTKKNNIEEPRLPGLNYSPRQMFWISAASFYCGKFTTEYLKDSVNNGYHSPVEARVKLTSRNSVQFAEDFGCKLGSKMNPVEKCDLW